MKTTHIRSHARVYTCVLCIRNSLYRLVVPLLGDFFYCYYRARRYLFDRLIFSLLSLDLLLWKIKFHFICVSCIDNYMLSQHHTHICLLHAHMHVFIHISYIKMCSLFMLGRFDSIVWLVKNREIWLVSKRAIWKYLHAVLRTHSCTGMHTVTKRHAYTYASICIHQCVDSLCETI